MPQNITQQEAIDQIVQIIAKISKKDPYKQQKYKMFLQESGEYHYDNSSLVHDLNPLKEDRNGNASMEHFNLIRLTQMFLYPTSIICSDDYKKPRFDINELISAIENIKNPSTTPELLQAVQYSRVTSRAPNITCSIQ